MRFPSGENVGWYSALSVVVMRRMAPVAGEIADEVVVEEVVGIVIEVRDAQDLAAVGRPVDRVVLARAGGERARRPAGDIDEEDLAAPVVVEARVALARVGLVEVARDHDRIAGRVGGLGPGHRGDESDRAAVGRPGERWSPRR